MISRPTDLPSFALPPVHEVVLSVQFDELHVVRLIDVHDIWERFDKAAFPIVEEQMALAPTFETFGASFMPAMPSFEAFSGTPWPRFWFVKADQTEVIQFQRDRLLHNWRKLDRDAAYPRYEPLRAVFEQKLNALAAFVSERQITLVPNQCEISYVNSIVLDDQEDAFARVFRHWTRTGTSGFGTPEAASFVTQQIITTENGPVGRLYIDARCGRTPDGNVIVRLTLTVRGRPQSPTAKDVLAFLDMGHEKIVRGFADLTTLEMHALWERHDQ